MTVHAAIHAAAGPRETLLPELDCAPMTAMLTGRCGWAPERAEAASAQYRMFLALHRLFPAERHALPSDADAVWHAHILHTARYRADMERILGRFLDHDPHGDVPDAERRLGEARFRELFGVVVECDAASM
ncbi:MAG: hypothetical protein ACRCTI_14415 [Beijerinckiaceae bacterium]